MATGIHGGDITTGSFGVVRTGSSVLLTEC